MSDFIEILMLLGFMLVLVGVSLICGFLISTTNDGDPADMAIFFAYVLVVLVCTFLFGFLMKREGYIPSKAEHTKVTYEIESEV